MSEYKIHTAHRALENLHEILSMEGQQQITVEIIIGAAIVFLALDAAEKNLEYDTITNHYANHQ